ncbi:uncharacterized protein [Oscarella lobularis]|uniref:uncharacterized protein n=1 Tax=Oscarella lobularis TaxID=121494 RepID=UPI0033130E4B
MSSACPSSRMGHVAAVINDEMLVWGGFAVRESTGKMYVRSPELIECFNLLTSQWNERRATSNSPSDLPHPCFHARICVVQNRDIYQFGGFYFSSDQGRLVYLNDVHKLDGSTLEWQRIHSNDQSTPSGRESHGMCVLGKKGDEHLVIMGGHGTTIVSPIPDGSQFIPSSKYPNEGWNNEVWLFGIRKRNWIPAQCTGKKPLPRDSHSFTSVDINRAILIGGGPEEVLNDAFLFMFSSLEWIEMKLDDHLIPRFDHSTVVVDIPTLGGPVAFLLWGYGKDFFPLSLAQMILIDFQKCKKVSISDEPIPTGRQAVCSIVRRGLLFILRYGGSPYKESEGTPEALLDIFKYDLENISEKLLRHDMNEPIEQETSKYDKNAPFRSNSPTMNCEGLSQKERDLLHPSPQRVEDVIAVVTPQSVLIFTRWKRFATPVSLDKGAEISIPNTGSTLRIHPRTALSPTPKTTMSLTLFTFDAKQSQGLLDDEFVSDLIQLSLPSGLSDDDVHIEMCHEHGLNLDPMTPKTSASKVVFFYQPHDHLATTKHPIKFDEKIVIDRAGERKIAALLQSSVVKVIVSPSAPAAAASAVAVASSNEDVSCCFFTHFYGLGQQAFSFHAISFEKIKNPDEWQFDLCIISTRPEHRDRYLAHRNDDRIRPLLFEQRVKNLVLSRTDLNVVEADDIEGWINESRVKRKYVNMQQLLAARDSPIDAWVDTFHFTYNRREVLQRLPTISAYVTIVSGDRRQCLGIQRSASSYICDHVDGALQLQELNVITTDKQGRLEPSREMALEYNHLISKWTICRLSCALNG